MADDNLAARREARRRRILENSQTRLQKITGRTDNERTGVENGPAGGLDGGGFGFYNGLAVDSTAGDSKLLQLLEKLGGPEGKDGDAEQRERRQPTLLQRVVATRVHMVVLAALVQWLLASEYGFVFGESMLAPLVVWELTQLLLLRPANLHDAARVDLVTAVLVLCGISAQAAVRTKQWLLHTLIVLQDCVVYFVTLLLCNKAIQWVA